MSPELFHLCGETKKTVSLMQCDNTIRDSDEIERKNDTIKRRDRHS